MKHNDLYDVVSSFYDFLTDRQFLVFCLMFGYNDWGITLSKGELATLLNVRQSTIESTYQAILDKCSQRQFKPLLDELQRYRIEY